MGERSSWDDFLAGRITPESTAIAVGAPPAEEKKAPPDWKKIYKELYADDDFRRDHLPVLLELGKLVNPKISLDDKSRGAIEKEVLQAYEEFIQHKKRKTAPASIPAGVS